MLKTALLIVALVAQVFAQQTVYIDPLNPGRVRSVPLAQSAPGSGDVVTSGTNAMTGYTNFSSGSFRFPEKTVATLPAAASNTGKVYRVTDGANAQDCTTGSGSTSSTCYSNGSAWIPMFFISGFSQLPALTASRVPVTDGSGIITASAVTATELGYVSGVTSAIQTQLGTKGDASSNTSSSVDSEIALFSGTGGKTFKRATQTGVAKLASGVIGVVGGTSTNCVLVDGTSTPCSGATGLADPGSNGMLARTASNTTAARTLTSSDSTISWANGNGVSANPDATVNSALVLLRSTDQSGVGRYCASADSAGTTYTCALSPTLNVADFVAGSTFLWTRSASCTSGTSLTLNINGLGAKSVFAADGSTVLTTAECLAGRPLHLTYNGTHFRVIGGGAAGSGVGDALVANPLSQFAATTSAQLRGVLSDETGGDAAVFATSPSLTTPAIAGMTGTGTADFSGATALIAVKGTAAPSGTACDAAGEEGSIYVRTGDPGASVITQTYHCTKTGSSSWAWKPISHGIGASDPTKCDEGQLFYNTTSDTFRMCTAADTWAAVGGGSSGTANDSPFFPFGGLDVNSSGVGASTAREVRFYEFEVLPPGKIVTSVNTATAATGGIFAFALYDSSCAIIVQTETKNVGSTDDDELFALTAAQTLTPGKYYIGVAEQAGTGHLRRAFGHYMPAGGRTSSNFPYFRVTGTEATYSAPNLTMPSSCTGTRVSLNASSPYAIRPFVAFF